MKCTRIYRKYFIASTSDYNLRMADFYKSLPALVTSQYNTLKSVTGSWAPKWVQLSTIAMNGGRSREKEENWFIFILDGELNSCGYILVREGLLIQQLVELARVADLIKSTRSSK